MDTVGADLKGGRDTVPQQKRDGTLGADRTQPADPFVRSAAGGSEVEHESDAATDRERGIQLRGERPGIEPRRAEQQELAAGRGGIDGLVRAAHASPR